VQQLRSLPGKPAPEPEVEKPVGCKACKDTGQIWPEGVAYPRDYLAYRMDELGVMGCPVCDRGRQFQRDLDDLKADREKTGEAVAITDASPR
jgi:hypothetical protein